MEEQSTIQTETNDVTTDQQIQIQIQNSVEIVEDEKLSADDDISIPTSEEQTGPADQTT